MHVMHVYRKIKLSGVYQSRSNIRLNASRYLLAPEIFIFRKERVLIDTISGEDGAKEKVEDVENAGES